MAHGEGEQGAAIAAAVLPAVAGLDDERARFYGDLVLNSLNEAARRALEAMMKGYEYQSDFAKKYVAQGRRAQREARRARARAHRAPGSRHRGAGRRARAHPGREGSGAARALARAGRPSPHRRRGARRAELIASPPAPPNQALVPTAHLAALRPARRPAAQRQGVGPPAQRGELHHMTES